MLLELLVPAGPFPHSSARAASIPELADVLEPNATPDFAFADTVHLTDLVEPHAPSVRAIVNPTPSAIRSFHPSYDESARSGSDTPLAFPLPDTSGPEASPSTRLRVLWANVRHGLRGALEELAELWEQTAHVAQVDRRPDLEPSSRKRGLARRVRALWGSWEWERSDLQRAAMIGLGVFAAATLGAALVVASSDEGARTSATRSADGSLSAGAPPASHLVRTPRTLDQRTGRSGAVRAKAKR